MRLGNCGGICAAAAFGPTQRRRAGRVIKTRRWNKITMTLGVRLLVLVLLAGLPVLALQVHGLVQDGERRKAAIAEQALGLARLGRRFSQRHCSVVCSRWGAPTTSRPGTSGRARGCTILFAANSRLMSAPIAIGSGSSGRTRSCLLGPLGLAPRTGSGLRPALQCSKGARAAGRPNLR